MIFKKKVGHSATTWREIYPEVVIVGKLASGVSVETIHGYSGTFVSVWLYSIRTRVVVARKRYWLGAQTSAENSPVRRPITPEVTESHFMPDPLNGRGDMELSLSF